MAGNQGKLAALTLLLAATAMTGAIAAPASAQSLHAGTLEVPLNKSQVVSTDRTIARAMIASADIAEVVPITERQVYVLGKKMGTTSLTLYDRMGRVISIIDIAVGPDVIGLTDQLQQLIPGDKIEAHISNESVVLTGMVNSAGSADRALQIAKSYAGDKVINLISMGSSQQVMLEVRFAEVTRSTGKEIEAKLGVRSADGTFNSVTGTNSSFIPGLTSSSTNLSNNSTNNSANGISNSTTNGSTNSTTNGTSLLLGNQAQAASGNTPPFTGSAADFTNLGTLSNKTFTGIGQAGASGTTANGTTGSTVSNLTNSIGATTVGAAQTATSLLSSIFQMGAVSGGFGIFSKQFNIGNTSIQALLNAMETRGLAKTLAQPTLVALSGEKASFLAGGEFPVPVAQSGNNAGGNNAITVEFKAFGVSLSFTPTVLADKTISMIVEPEVSAIDPASSLTVGGITIPGLRTRRASTTLELRDGESFAIAGLISKDFQTTVKQVPLLASIPIIGALFRSSSFQKGETELLIVVTPHLVQPIRSGQIRLPTDRVLDPREGDTFLLGQPYRPVKVEPAAPPTRSGSPQSAAPSGAPPQASAELAPAPAPAPAKEDSYAY